MFDKSYRAVRSRRTLSDELVWQIRLNPVLKKFSRPAAATQAWSFEAITAMHGARQRPHHTARNTKNSEMVHYRPELVEALQRLRQRRSLIMAMQRE